MQINLQFAFLNFAFFYNFDWFAFFISAFFIIVLSICNPKIFIFCHQMNNESKNCSYNLSLFVDVTFLSSFFIVFPQDMQFHKQPLRVRAVLISFLQSKYIRDYDLTHGSSACKFFHIWNS